MAERSDEAFIIVREFMTRGLGLSGLPLLVYARIYGFCGSGSPYYESKAHLGKILGADTRRPRGRPRSPHARSSRICQGRPRAVSVKR